MAKRPRDPNRHLALYLTGMNGSVEMERVLTNTSYRFKRSLFTKKPATTG